jgi:TRAP-type C4-dicarboxylate transport system substrate-binding protein
MGAYENDLKFKSRRAKERKFTRPKEIKMFTHRLFRLFRLLSIVAFVIITACTSLPAATSAQDEPITLRLAVADPEDRPSDPYVREFIEQVKTLSNGKITIEPTWDAGSTTEVGFETGVIQLVRKGQYDLGLAASRAFDNENVTSFQALQAPFLIANDALAQAVATNDIAMQMLDHLSSAGMMGLTLWPEDLRHPFSLIPDKPLLAPEDFAGLNIRATPSRLTYKMIETLGGKPMFEDGGYEGAESGLRQGASLTGTPTATGNVVFFPKFQVLFANGPAFEKLNEAQRKVLRDAAIATQKKAIAAHPSEVDAATAWCADGGSIVLASTEQVAAFETAAQPIFDSIAQDALNAEFITAIRTLKANTQPSAGAEACNGVVAQASPEPTAENQVWSEGLPPNGVWQVELTSDDFLRMGLIRSAAVDWVGTYTTKYQDGKSIEDFKGPARTTHCEADLQVVGDVVRETYTSSVPRNVCLDPVVVFEFQWRLDDDGLHLHLVSIKEAPFLENAAVLDAKPWQKIADP